MDARTGEPDELGRHRDAWLESRRRIHAAQHAGDTATEARLAVERELLAAQMLVGESRLLRAWARQALADLRRQRADAA